jgi:high-affinity iron transporter
MPNLLLMFYKGCPRAALLALLLVCPLLAAPPESETSSVQTAWRLLDYIAVDYREAVTGGEVINPGEFEEMVEFSRSASERIAELSDHPAKIDLQARAAALERAIGDKGEPDQIASVCRTLAADLVVAYPVPLAPTKTPDMARARVLYERNCMSCHGQSGNADGPGSVGLDPPPIAFTDKERAKERSVFGLYQVIGQGLDGTSMASYGSLPPEDRWALAFYVGSFSYPEHDAAQGEQVWKSHLELQARFGLKEVVAMTPAALGETLEPGQGDSLTAFLRRHPEVLEKTYTGSLALTRKRLAESLAAYKEGDRKAATDLALSAYLDGFEPVEPTLAARDSALMAKIEQAMGALRQAIAEGRPVETVRERIEAVDTLFAQAEEILGSGSATVGTSFFGVLTILLREGLEALLIVVAMVTFLRRAERTDALVYVHAGWVAALFTGVLTWGAANWFVSISGATREMTEGLGSVIAALILLWIGVWMHGKSQANVWQRYIRERLSSALTGRSAWFLFGLSFLVVYREAFETILFCVAIWNQGNGAAMLAGAVVASLMLAAVAAAMLWYSKTLPIRQFFAYSSTLIAVLAVVLIGKGTAALQEAGYFSVHSLVGLPRIELLGMYPTMEGAAAQMLMLLLLGIGFAHNWRTARQAD